MLNIRPVSDLRNNFTSIERIVNDGDPVFLTKNGYGTMVVLSIEQYCKLTEDVELALDEADRYAKSTDERMTHSEVFSQLRETANGTRI